MVAEESLREEDASKRKMEGSLMIFEAGSVAEVREYIENDPYWVGNVVSPHLDPLLEMRSMAERRFDWLGVVGQGEAGYQAVHYAQALDV